MKDITSELTVFDFPQNTLFLEDNKKKKKKKNITARFALLFFVLIVSF